MSNFKVILHFCFSVSCKSVGFKVYNLRRFIGACFDVYFHLWSNGAPYWECEKFLWEQEQEREWTTVSSRRNKSSFCSQACAVSSSAQASTFECSWF
jgi:hypothetical protein